MKADLEIAELQRTNLENQLESKKKQLASEVADLKRHVSDLNDENDALHLKNHQLNDQIDEFKKLKVMQPSEFDALNKEVKHARQTIRKLRRKIQRFNDNQKIAGKRQSMKTPKKNLVILWMQAQMGTICVMTFLSAMLRITPSVTIWSS